MELKMTQKQFRRLLDLVYIGNWVLNSTRGDDRIREYDQVESLVFSHCLSQGMSSLTELYHGELIPSRDFAEVVVTMEDGEETSEQAPHELPAAFMLLTGYYDYRFVDKNGDDMAG